MKELPKYKCHKTVWALKIASLELVESGPGGTESRYLMGFHDAGYGPIEVDGDWVFKRGAKAEGYYVVYANGHTSWSPADAFEDGYTRIGGE